MGNICSSKQTDESDSSNSDQSSGPCEFNLIEKEGLVPLKATPMSTIMVEQHQAPADPAKFSQPVPKTDHHPPPSVSVADSVTVCGSETSDKAPVDEKPKIPASLTGLSENLQHLLLGATEMSKSCYRSRKIVVYICAADSQDCCAEKGILHNEVLPIIRDKCRHRGYELHVVDLHWRTALEKQQDHEFPELCLGELARQSEIAYIIPILFLSNSLGTPLLPKTIEEQDFEIALDKADNKELLKKWYHKDELAQPPCYRLQPVASYIPGFKTEGKTETEEVLNAWRSEIERILSVMIAAFSLEQRDSYLTTVVEQEVHNTVIMSRELAKRCVWINRIYTHLAEEPKVEPELKRRLENLQRDLKNQLDEKYIIKLGVKWLSGGLNMEHPEHVQYLNLVKDKLMDHLKNIVEAIITEDQAKAVLNSQYGVSKSLLDELVIQTYYSQQMAKCSFDREEVLKKIQNYLMSDYNKPFIVHGQSGCGKTTVLARTVKSCQTYLSDYAIIFRYANISPQSSSLPQLLSNIVQHISTINCGHQVSVDHNIATYSRILPNLLANNVNNRNLIIIIDGLDQVKFSNCDWLPETLPPNVKLILSVNDQSSLCKSLKTKFTNDSSYLKIPELSQTEAESILLSSIMEYNHNIDKKVQECVKTNIKECALPLHIKVLAWQMSWWNGLKLVADPKTQMTLFLDELEFMFGKDKIEFTFALLSNSNFGLTDSEMLDLLSREEVFHSNTTYLLWAPACQFWASLNKRINPFLNWFMTAKDSSVRWQDESIRSLVLERYSDKTSWALETLRKYYRDDLWNKSTDSKLTARIISQPIKFSHCYNQRKLDELPTLEYRHSGSIRTDYLENLNWLYSKICGSSIFNVLDDVYLEGSSHDADANVRWLRNFLESSSTALAYDGRQFYTQANIFISKHPDQECSLYQKFKITAQNPPVLSLMPYSSSLASVEEKKSEENLVYFNDVQRLPKGDSFVVTISTEKEEIAVWNIKTCSRVRLLRGIPQPMTLKMIDNYRCVVLCKRELRTYDLNTGTLLTKLKGVMNQKMPYYGLHDACHLVSLSRNRMYVNLMNINSGDLITAFKAGEDRFLNSLLVSGDGKVLVCGDETQKPFPLLVWNLASRKLLYDLRIPHHDFITSLAAITYEGHYVCCVAKEVDEPGPNFIVVYDLQSGTLFKKWKPSVNCVSLEISSREGRGCVLSGHEDGRILVWDLITGNCRWTLKGHTAPVTCLRLDSLGGAFLSSDSECRDKSIRLWNLNDGELTAVYTPSGRITASEVLSGGRHVVLAKESSSKLIILQLVGPNVPTQSVEEEVYGLPENASKEFDLKEER